MMTCGVLQASSRFTTNVDAAPKTTDATSRTISTSSIEFSAAQSQDRPTEALFASADNAPSAGGVPAGTYAYFSAATCPTGWKPANGTDGTLDLRGEFIRGWDAGRGLDPNSGRGVGSIQGQEIDNHRHTGRTDIDGYHSHSIGNSGSKGWNNGVFYWGERGGSPWQTSNATRGAGNHRHNFTTSYTGGAETRPRNVAMNICVSP